MEPLAFFRIESGACAAQGPPEAAALLRRHDGGSYGPPLAASVGFSGARHAEEHIRVSSTRYIPVPRRPRPGDPPLRPRRRDGLIVAAHRRAQSKCRGTPYRRTVVPVARARRKSASGAVRAALRGPRSEAHFRCSPGRPAPTALRTSVAARATRADPLDSVVETLAQPAKRPVFAEQNRCTRPG